MIILKNILGILTDPKNTRMFLLGGIVVLSILLFRQCEQTNLAKNEVTRISNNWKASLDTIQNYVDENGNAVAQIRALNTSLQEVKGELKFGDFDSALSFSDKKEWGRSTRTIDAIVPYKTTENNITFGNANIGLQQNIFLTASLTRDSETKELFVNLLTDYPGTTFNNAEGILINKKSSEFKGLQYENRKTIGLGLQLGVGLSGTQLSSYVGIGLSYTPKFLQW